MTRVPNGLQPVRDTSHLDDALTIRSVEHRDGAELEDRGFGLVHVLFLLFLSFVFVNGLLCRGFLGGGSLLGI